MKKEINKDILQQIIDYVWELESDCVTMELESANYDERCMYSKSAEVLTKIRNYVDGLM